MPTEENTVQWKESQIEAFNFWADGNVIEYRVNDSSEWAMAGDSVLLSMDSEYRIKLKQSLSGGEPKPFKKRGNFRFRWKDELNSWLSGRDVKFYDDKKKEWHHLTPDKHVWDCITIYED